MTAPRRIAALLAAAAFTAAAPAFTAPALAADLTPVPVEVWRNGDDGMTGAFVNVILEAFKTSPGFTLTTEGERVKVQLDSVGGEPAGGHGPFNYRVEITPVGQPMTIISGNCYEDAMPDCASFIVDRTYGVVKQPRPTESRKK